MVLSAAAAACGAKQPALVSHPLKVAAGQTTTLLADVQPASTGLEFQNRLAESTLNRYLFRGAGVAAGDVDGDGLADLYFVSEESGNRLYRNLGQFRFEDITARAGLEEAEPPPGYGAGAQFADVDSDGDLDLYVTNWKSSNRLYENQGDGTFEDITAKSGAGYTGGSDTPTFGDFDRDGDLDLYVANYRPSALQYERKSLRLKRVGNRLVVPPELADRIEFVNGRLREHGETDLLYANRGDGTFDEVGLAAGIAPHGWGLAAMFADADGDLWPDLYVTNDLWSPDRFYHNRGDGSFSLVDRRRVQYTPMFSMGLDFADINNDGAMDLVIGDMLSRDHPRRMTQHGLADEGDLSQSMGGDTPQFMRNVLYLNTGRGTFEEIAWLAGVAASEWTWTTKFADLDLDGFVDLLVTNGMVRDLMDSDYTARAKALNRTADRDTVLAFLTQYPALPTANLAFRNTGHLTFEDVSEAWGFTSTDVGHGLAVADLDGDGDLDLAVNNMNAPARLYRNDSVTPRLAVRLVGRDSNSHGLGARLTLTTTRGAQVREMTSSGGYLSGHEALVVFGLGDPPATIRALDVEWPSGHRQILKAAEEPGLVANAEVTITEPGGRASPAPPPGPPATLFRDVAAGAGLSFHHRESPFPDFEVQPLLPRRLSTLGPGVALGDADGDGDDDVAVAGGSGQAPGIFINRGDGTFDAVPGGNSGPGDGLAPLWWPPGVAGDLDLLLSLSTEENPAGPTGARYKAIGRGHGSTPSAWSPAANASGGALAASDVDSDGDLDLFAGGRYVPGQWPLAAPSRLFENRGGSLIDVTADRAPDLSTLGLATGATWADLDGDGDDDLLVATEWGPVHLLENRGGRLAEATARAGLADTTGLWNGVAPGDLDGDGDLDFVVTNIGANGRHQLARPPRLVVYAGEIDDAPGLDIVEGYSIGDTLYPVRERGTTGKAMPFVLGAFPTFASYASASLGQIFGRRLEGTGTIRLEADTFLSTAFMNDGRGRFEPQPLPTAAQISTAFGVVIADLDVDGHEDIYLVGNFSGNDPDSGPTGAGVSAWLRGLGDGAFEAVSPATSGLLVPDEARGLAVGDLDGDLRPDVVVGVSNGRAEVFQNVGHGPRHAIGLRLTGPAANPTGIGSLVTVTRRDGTRSVKEITAGGGYFSQNSATLVFGLGTSAAPVSVTVRWPDGHLTTVEAAAADQLLTIDRNQPIAP